MGRRVPVVLLWTLLGLTAAGIVFASARPFAVGWACYRRAASGERVDAEVVGKHETVGLVLRIASGTQAGETCSAGTSEALFRAARSGDVLPVVVQAERPGDCELVSTLEASAALLWAFTGALVAVLLALGLLGVRLQRRLARLRSGP